MSADQVKEIEITSNASAKYDAKGSGGVINLKFKKGAYYGANGSINLGYAQGVYPKANSANIYTNKAFCLFKQLFFKTSDLSEQKIILKSCASKQN